MSGIHHLNTDAARLAQILDYVYTTCDDVTAASSEHCDIKDYGQMHDLVAKYHLASEFANLMETAREDFAILFRGMINMMG